jgi:arylsulfatase A-like enzyme
MLAALLSASLFSCGGEQDGGSGSSGSPPNVLLIVIDTLRKDALGCLGNERDLTPELDRLAGEGVLFTGARSSSSWTLPAHASLFSSSLPAQHGVLVQTRRLPDHYVTLAEVLREGGWRTGGFTDGGFVLPMYGYMKGFDWIHVSPDADRKTGERYGVEYVTERALKWIRRKPGPFFVFLQTYEVHSPFDAPEPFRSRFVRPYEGPLPRVPGMRRVNQSYDAGELTENDLRYLHDLYLAGVAYTDHVLGKLFEELRRDGLLDSTLVVVTSDHGEDFGEHGHLGHGDWLHESLLEVPLIVRFPGNYDGGATAEQPVRLVDIAPSILELAGLEIPEDWVGLSLHEVDAERDFLASVTRTEKTATPGAAVEERTAHAILEGSQKWVRYGPGFEPTWTSAGEQRFTRFDLGADPSEGVDLFTEDSRAAALARFGELLGRYPQDGVAERSKHSDKELSTLRALGYTE